MQSSHKNNDINRNQLLNKCSNIIYSTSIAALVPWEALKILQVRKPVQGKIIWLGKIFRCWTIHILVTFTIHRTTKSTSYVFFIQRNNEIYLQENNDMTKKHTLNTRFWRILRWQFLRKCRIDKKEPNVS